MTNAEAGLNLRDVDEVEVRGEYGGFWIRVAAHSVDTAVMLVPIMNIFTLLHFTIPAESELEVALVELVERGVSFIVWWVYFAAMHSSAWQGSIGKMMLGLKVVDANGSRISFRKASKRYFGLVLSGMLLCVGFLMVGWTKRKQGLHDLIANTYVVRSRRA